MKNPKFKIGDPVLVRVCTVLDLDEEKVNKICYRKKVDIFGLIVGAIYRYTGKLILGDYRQDDYEPNYLQVDKSVLLWQVRTGYLNKPIEAMEKDIVLVTSDVGTIPWIYKRKRVNQKKGKEK